MELRDAVLYHQVHPAKLATDVASSVVSPYLLWRRRLLLALLVTFVPPIAIAAGLAVVLVAWFRGLLGRIG